jgi:hypothetical protein
MGGFHPGLLPTDKSRFVDGREQTAVMNGDKKRPNSGGVLICGERRMGNGQSRFNRTTWRLFVVLGVLICVSAMPFAFSQDVPLSTDRFYVGEGIDQSLESARSAALQALMLQVQAFVSTSFVHVKRESGGQVEDSAAASVVVRSAMTLKDVGERIARVGDDNYRVLKYVSKESVRELFRLRKARVIELLKQASADIRSGSPPDVSSCLKRSYWSYLLAVIHPDTMRVPLEYVDDGGGFSNDATVLSEVPRIMDRMLRQIHFQPLRKFVDGETTVWRCAVQYVGKPVKHLDYEYFDGIGSMSGEARDGETSLNLYLRGDTLRPRDVSVRVDYRFEEEMDDLLRTADSLSSTRTLMQPLIVTLPGSSPVSATSLAGGKVSVPPVKDLDGKGIPNAIEAILNATGGFEGIMQTLQFLEKQQKIITGSAYRFENLEGLYGAILSREGLAAIVHQKGGRLTDVRSGAEVDMKSYKGMRVTWIQVLEKETP